MVVQGIKDRSKIRNHMVTEKQGNRDESETRGTREGNQGKTKEDPEMGVYGKKGRSREDPGKIHRSRGFSVQECQRRIGGGQGWRDKDK